MYGLGAYLIVLDPHARKVCSLPLAIVAVLFLLFTVAWIFGLIGTSDSLERSTYVAAQYIFSVLVFVHSILTVFLYIMWSTESRNKWYGFITCNRHGKKAYSTAGEVQPSPGGTELTTSYNRRTSAAPEDATPLTPTDKKQVQNIYTPSPGATDDMQERDEQVKVNLNVDDEDDDDKVVTSL